KVASRSRANESASVVKRPRDSAKKKAGVTVRLSRSTQTVGPLGLSRRRKQSNPGVNAAPQPLPKAEAQRTLEAVGCRRVFGQVLASCAPAHSVPHNTYWITSSARRSSDGDIVIPSALAVSRLITNPNLFRLVTRLPP